MASFHLEASASYDLNDGGEAENNFSCCKCFRKCLHVMNQVFSTIFHNSDIASDILYILYTSFYSKALYIICITSLALPFLIVLILSLWKNKGILNACEAFWRTSLHCVYFQRNLESDQTYRRTTCNKLFFVVFEDFPMLII